MNYGFVIDNRKCIGCHACSTACKSENQVPLGVNRTWVKTVDVGEYPDVRRQFQVTRCNHCANPPCVRICPVTAMYQRDNGIVEFDSDTCIGCKACMQACPYDAIYVDPDTSTVAKCHFCGHRTEVGLEPACVVVCPEHAILSGDIDDPRSEISKVLAKHNTTVRKPEQGTAPKLFYIEGGDATMHPTAVPREPAGMMFTDVQPLHGGPRRPAYQDASQVPAHRVELRLEGLAASPLTTSPTGSTIRVPAAQGSAPGGPISIGQGRMAEHMVQVGYTAQHRIPWHWPVPAYLVTKGIGTGIFGLLAAGILSGWFPVNSAVVVAAGGLGLVATLATTPLRGAELARTERFLSIVLRPQWKSWLTRGAFLLIGFSTLSGLWWGVELMGLLGWLEPALVQSARLPLAGLTLPLALGAAIYTAFLFAQAEGRDLWQSPLLPPHLLIQAAMLGGGGLLALSPVVDLDPSLAAAARLTFAVGLIADLAVTLLGEFGIAHASEVAARAAHDISHGRYARQFWWGSVVLGHVLPLALLPLHAAAPVAALAAAVGLYFYEHAFVMAPQDIPNS